jgi:putative transposase
MNNQKRHKPAEIILSLREFDSGSLSQESFCQQKQISVVTLNRWRKKYGMMEVADAKRLKALEEENAELKKMYADATLETGSMPSRTRITIEKKL